MAKEVQMSIKMEAELRDPFMAVAAALHRPAAQALWYFRCAIRFVPAGSSAT